ncbi:MAG: ATP phosphoribosyltransferase [Bacteroidetes bacterium GWF2_40_14]|nr:MAG: ATP phosphoribosyltransferase [Bacteroidetes bacterium GWF2_40_14]
MIRLAIQAKGRLNEESLDLLKESGLVVEPSKKKLLTKCGDFPLEILFLRDDDIPQAVSMGVADIGIVGLNEVEERSFIVDKVHNLAFGKCRLSLAIPKSEIYNGIGYFQGKRIATSYPVLLERYFKKEGITAEIHQIAGSVEIAPSVGLADAIFDIVSSGGTLITNGLKEVVSVMDSQAVLIATPNMESDKRDILKQLMMRFEAVERSKGMKYLLMNLPLDRLDDATEMLPGMRSPTILPLAQKGWCSVHVVVEEKQLWDRIEGLKSIGAEGILVLSLEKMMP